MKKASLKSKLLLSCLFILILLISGYLYLNLYFVPYKLKDVLSGQVEKLLHRTVTIESVDINLIKGITIKNLIVADNNKELKPLITAQEVNVKLLFAPIFKNKIVFIPELRFQSPEISIIRDSESNWNFSDLLPQSPSETTTPSKYQFVIQNLIVENGSIHFNDQSQEKPFHESFNQLQLKASLSLTHKIQFDAKTTLINTQSLLKLKGTYDIPTQKGQAEIALQNFSPNEYLSILLKGNTNIFQSGVVTQANLKINMSGSQIDISGKTELNQMKLSLAPDQTVEGNFTLPHFTARYNKGTLMLQGEANIQGLNLNIPPLFIHQADINAQIDSLNISEQTISYKGSITSQSLKLKVAPDLDFTGDVTLSNVTATKSPVETLKLNGALSAKNVSAEMTHDHQKLIFSGDISTSIINLTKNKNDWNINSDFNLISATFDLGNGINLKDSFAGTLALQGSMLEPNQFQYASAFQFSDASLTGISTIQTIEHLKGNMSLENDKAILTSISFQTQNVPVTVNGEVTNFAQPMGNLSIKIPTINLENLPPLLMHFVKNIPDTFTGSADVNVEMQGSLTDIFSTDLNIVSHFKNVNINDARLPFPIANMSGELTTSKDKAELKNCKLTILDQEYLLNAQADNFKEPNFKGALTSESLNLNTEGKIINGLVQVTKMNGKYFNSNFDLQGNVQTHKNQSPTLNLTGSAELSLDDLKNIPQLSEQMNRYNPTGLLSIDGNFKGNLKDIKSWQTEFKAVSPQVSISNLLIQEVKIHYAQSDINFVGNLDASALVYDGKFSSAALIQTDQPDLPLQLTASIDQMNLKLLRKDLKTAADNLSGFFTSSVTLDGNLMNINGLTGEGSIVVVEGYLGQLKFLSGILGALLVIPEFKNIYITDASVNFAIQDEKISSDNILLTSPTVQLNGKGWIDFKSNINIKVSPEISQIELVKSSSAKKLSTQLLASTISVKCTGTMSKPHCGLDNAPVKILKGTTDILKGGIKGVGGMLEEMF